MDHSSEFELGCSQGKKRDPIPEDKKSDPVYVMGYWYGFGYELAAERIRSNWRMEGLPHDLQQAINLHKLTPEFAASLFEGAGDRCAAESATVI